MELPVVIFVSVVVLVGVVLTLQVRATLRSAAPPDPHRERQLMAYEERRMRVRRDRVWRRVEAMHSEFNERHSPEAARDAAPEAARPGGEPDAFTHGELKDAFERFGAAPREGRGDGPPPAVK